MKDTGKQTRAKIIQTIEDLLAKKSLDQISIREICQKANIAVGTFYIYFSSKEAALLYVYHQLDEQFEELILDQQPADNIKTILITYYNMTKLEPLPVYRTLYCCHLSYYDDYYFDEKRPVFVVLNHEILKLVNNKQVAKEITWLVLDFCRGRIFNFLIKYQDDVDSWIDEQLQLTMNYLKFLINDKTSGGKICINI